MIFCRSKLLNSAGQSTWTRKSIPMHRSPLSSDSSDEGNLMLTREVMDEEILQKVNQLTPLKTPAPDGMHAGLYEKG